MNKDNPSKKILALGIPTYKRPEFAIRLINKALKIEVYDQIIVCSNSREEILTDFIESKKQDNLIFFQQKENVGLAMNYLKIIELCDCEYLYVVSDEDLPNEENTKRLYQNLSSFEPTSIVVTSVEDEEGKIYKDATWQKNDHLIDLLGETAHIGSNIINARMIGANEIKLLSKYCQREGSVYVGPAAALIAYSVGGNLKYFPPTTVEMGQLHEVREISGYSIYGFKSRLDQYHNFYYLMKSLRLRKKHTIYANILYYFSHHALQDAKRKFDERPSAIFFGFIKNKTLSLGSITALMILCFAFYIFYFYFKSRSFASYFLKRKAS